MRHPAAQPSAAAGKSKPKPNCPGARPGRRGPRAGELAAARAGPATTSGRAPPPATPVPPASAPAPTPPAPGPARPAPAQFFVPLVPPTPLLAFLPPPIPTPARPTPPSGTSAVTSPVEVAQREEEEEEATESVSNQAVAYRAAEHEPVPEYLLGIVLLAALAGASMRRRPRRGRRHARVAPATLTTSRFQRRSGRRTDGDRDVNRW